MNYRQRTLMIALWVLASLGFFPTNLTGAPRPSPLDYEGQIDVLGELLAKEGSRYKLHVLDLFEEKKPLRGRANSNMLSLAYYVRRAPKHPAYQKEKELLKKYSKKTVGFSRTLGLETAFEIPGEESWQILYVHPIPIGGQLVRVSLWVKSKNYKHRLFLLFKNANGRKIRVDAGPLDWHGWRRLSIDLPHSLYERGSRLNQRYPHFFLGFQIRSHKKEPAGSLYIELDNLLVLSDQEGLQYPGSEIRDDWKQP